MSWTISKDFTFSASHQLVGLPDGHPCARLHGHNYRVRLQITGPRLTGPGFVVDFRDLDGFKRWLDDHLDHRHLNDVPELVMAGQPTSELLARQLWDVAATELTRAVPAVQSIGTADDPAALQLTVGVSETDKTWAWWTP